MARYDSHFYTTMRMTGSQSKVSSRAFSTGFPPLRVFSYEDIKANVNVAMGIESVEKGFGKLAKGEVDVPIPMHIGIAETATAGPGDCHIKGGYIEVFLFSFRCASKDTVDRNQKRILELFEIPNRGLPLGQ